VATVRSSSLGLSLKNMVVQVLASLCNAVEIKSHLHYSKFGMCEGLSCLNF